VISLVTFGVISHRNENARRLELRTMDVSSPSRSHRHPFLVASFLLAASAATVFVAVGCSSEPASDGPVNPFSGAPSPTAGAGGAPASGGATSAIGAAGSGQPTAGSSAGASEGFGSNATGPLDNGTANNSGSSEPPASTDGSEVPPPPKPCVDSPAPFDAEWPEATCESWAFEANACGEDWFQNYCDVTCGRCTPDDGSGGPPMPPDCSGENLPNVTGGAGFATRYWDCCQPACAQNGGHKCSQDGVTQTGDNGSACSGGGAFACYDDAPRAVSNCLAYGHIAKANPNCGGCFRIQFTGSGHDNANDIGAKLIQGKQMIVKVTNTGSDVAGNQFDLMIPGGGVGLFNACSRQWGINDLGGQYGGFLTACTTGTHADKKECVRQKCMALPAGSARDGCLWFVDWFEIADNPNFNSEPTNCPF
jgi:glycosyl hydrolase family 45